MPENKKILIAVDGSEHSYRTVQHVADLLTANDGFHVGLLHLEIPPRMLEWGGSEDPAVEALVEAEREDTYQDLEKKKMAKGKSLLQRLQVLIADKGIDVTGLYVRFEEPLDTKSVAANILAAARKHHFGTIVVGRHGSSGWKGFFHRHVGEQLIREGEGITICVVG